MSAQHCLFWIICHRRFDYSLSSALFCRRVLARQNNVTYQCCYKVCWWIFLFWNLFFQNFFCQNFFQHFLTKKFFIIFFPKFFPKIFFSKFFFFPKFFTQSFFLTFFSQNFFPFTETKRTLCICVMKNMISKRSKLDFSLVWLFLGSYCLHHTRREKFNSFPATHNILLSFFQNLLYLIEVLKCFLDGI